MNDQWFAPAHLAAMKLPGMPDTERGIRLMAERDGWRARLNMAGEPLARRREGRGGGWEYHSTLLPTRAQMALVRELGAESAPAAPAGRSELWDWFARQPEKRKAVAGERAAAIRAVKILQKGGVQVNLAVATVAHQRAIGASTLYAWFNLVAGIEEADWLPHLCPRHQGRTSVAGLSPEAWEFIKADYLRPEKRPFENCYEDLRQAAAANGWQIPAARTLRRRIEREIPAAIVTLLRDGEEAARRMFPWQERDRTCFHALEAVNADNHTIDVMVRFPDGTVDRPSIIAVQDLYSNKILAWRVDLNPTATGTRLAFYDVFRAYGVMSLAFLDNGREFAAKLITGGQPTRYRFKVTAGEMDGVLTSLGVEVHWCRPYSGQSKPIERAFKEFCQAISTHPAFAGAYTGSSPTTKPANYGSRAVGFDEFMAVFAEGVRQYNARPGRRTRVCGGTMSFDDAFARSYAQSVITKATDEQLRMAMLAAEPVTARTPDGSIHLLGNRFWGEFLHERIGQKVVARFDPDDLHAGVHAYRLDGAYLGFAECWEAVGYLSVDQGREHNRDRKAWLKATKAMAAIERKWTPDMVAALMPEIDETPAPETKTVRMFAGNAAVAVAAPDPAAIQQNEKWFADTFHAGLQVVKGGRED
ncbi:transposase domain-containing protein [Shumkonia mesophila]|uniref:transposase domain-containing protein n=1 Tax=Shumkonia mesophila TaxID=2838854 RepID=UPI0029346981|nr:transposase domain-containing protein [Shumkonia mesophila]